MKYSNYLRCLNIPDGPDARNAFRLSKGLRYSEVKTLRRRFGVTFERRTRYELPAPAEAVAL